jgi:3-oxoadipate enol-lactonase
LNGARHYYRLEGAESLPPLLLVHPIGADLSLWDLVLPHLLTHFHVLRYDLRGHGGSEATPGDYSIDLLAHDLLEIASAVGWDEFSVCGVSVGAMTAARAASLAPQRVKCLVVCSASPHMHAPPGGWDARAATARKSGLQPLAGPMVERMFSAAFRESSHPHIETLRTVFLSTDPEGYASTVAVLRDADLSDSLSAIAASTLIVTGRGDPLVPPEAGAVFERGISGSRREEVNTGHFPPVEAPEQFAGLLFAHTRASPYRHRTSTQ